MYSAKQHISVSKIYRQLLRDFRDVIGYVEASAFRKRWLHSTGLDAQRIIGVIDITMREIGLGKSAIIGFTLAEEIAQGRLTLAEVEKNFDAHTSVIAKGLHNASELYTKGMAVETENFRKLLLTFAEDVRVILIMLAERLYVMRNLQYNSDENARMSIAREAAYLYAPLAHRLGLYAIKTELEDLSLKFTNPDIYHEIAHKLNESKASREAYIQSFIEPVKQELEKQGLKFSIKGRTKSIHSIYNKIKKQNTTFEGIYDLFAIRVILDSVDDPKVEKSECWNVFSVITDMYMPNINRLRDWISMPKANGYESLHITVKGPEDKWVEVQIRTRRMDEIAEKGVAAHWKYKGIKSEGAGMDDFLKTIRAILENPDANAAEMMDDFRLNLYDQEVFVFTPAGELHKLPAKASVLDFAYHIHSKLGDKCVGAKVNGKNVPIKYQLRNGDQVEILTSPTQKPSQAWLSLVVTSKARSKIRQAIKEQQYKDAEFGKEQLNRRLKNWKIEYDEGMVSRVSLKMGYKSVNDFFQDIAQYRVDLLSVRDVWNELIHRDEQQESETVSADGYVKQGATPTDDEGQRIKAEDVLTIGQGLKNVDYKLSKCCNPIFGDKIFGFVSVSGGIRIHRVDCPNAPQLIERFGYRIVPARWEGKSAGAQYAITLLVYGHDDIGIVTNITQVINKEKGTLLRSISIDANDGIFKGQLTIMVDDVKQLDGLIKKVGAIKGVSHVERG